MPPKSSTSAPKRKAPTFKPPRPASKATKTTAPRRKSAPVQRGRPSFIADQASASDDDEDDDMDELGDNLDDEDDSMPSDTHPPSASRGEDSDTSLPANVDTQDPPPTIPPALLTTLLHHHFKDSKMRIGKEANGVVGKYMETFVREAIARAAYERNEAAANGATSSIAGEFLEVRGSWFS